MKKYDFRLIIGISFLFLAGCAGYTKQLTLWSGEEIIFPNGTILAGASTEQASALAEIFVNAHNETIKQLKEIKEEQKQTAIQALKIIEEISKKQGTGEITLFFSTGSYRFNSLEQSRLVRFLDFLSRESHGRKILLISVGSASAFGNNQHNQRLADRRAKAPVDIVEKYLINIPYEFYKVYSVGDKYNSTNQSIKKQKNYQNTRLIAIFDANQSPVLPE